MYAFRLPGSEEFPCCIDEKIKILEVDEAEFDYSAARMFSVMLYPQPCIGKYSSLPVQGVLLHLCNEYFKRGIKQIIFAETGFSDAMLIHELSLLNKGLENPNVYTIQKEYIIVKK